MLHDCCMLILMLQIPPQWAFVKRPLIDVSSKWQLCAVQNGHKKYVLRKKPPGKVLASAHAVEREYQVHLSDTHHAITICIDQYSLILLHTLHILLVSMLP